MPSPRTGCDEILLRLGRPSSVVGKCNGQECPLHTCATPYRALWCHCAGLPCCVSVNKQQRFACKQQFPPGSTAKKRKFISGSTRSGSQNTSLLSWTAMADGPSGAICRA